jgi:hypothetical protein
VTLTRTGSEPLGKFRTPPLLTSCHSVNSFAVWGAASIAPPVLRREQTPICPRSSSSRRTRPSQSGSNTPADLSFVAERTASRGPLLALDRKTRYFIKNACFFSFRFFISSLIHRGVAPRPAQVSLGFALLLYLGGTFRPFIALTRRPRRPFPTSITPSLESCDLSSSAFRPSAASTSPRSFVRASTDIEASLLGRAIAFISN